MTTSLGGALWAWVRLFLFFLWSALIIDDGAVYTCGKNDRGQLGHGKTELSEKSKQHAESPWFTPCAFPSGVQIVQVEAGWDFVLALTDSQTLYSWGSNNFGQLGRTPKDQVKIDSTPQEIHTSTRNPAKFISVAAGLRHAIAITESFDVYTWGSGRRGQLGVVDDKDNPVSISDVPVLVPISITQRPIQAVAGMNFSGILTDDGSLYLFGCNKYGQCGLDSNMCLVLKQPTLVALPEELSSNHGSKIVSMAAGWTHAIARSELGILYSWGRSDLGQLGRSCNDTPGYRPARIDILDSIKSHCCSSEHNLALTDKCEVYSWGWNEHGICGTGDEENVFEPQLISSLANNITTLVGCGAGHCFSFSKDTTFEEKEPAS